MTDSYQVATAALSSHAQTLHELAGDLRAALDIVGSVTMTDDAYGRVGRPFATAVEQLCGSGQDTLRAGIDALEWAATTMNATASAYDQQEAAVAAGLDGISGELA
jgi:hypothetical protein